MPSKKERKKNQKKLTPVKILNAVSRGPAAGHRLLRPWPVGAVDTPDKEGHTALMMAIHSGVSQVVNDLLTIHKASPNVVTLGKTTPLLVAIITGNIAAIRALIKAGVDVNASDSDGATPLLSAVFQGDAKIARLLGDEGKADPVLHAHNDNSVMHTAVDMGNPEMVDALVNSCGADVDMPCTMQEGSTGVTALMMAVQHGKLDMVETLLECKADVDRRCDTGRTALYMAVEFEQFEVVKSLVLRHGASVQIASNRGVTALLAATATGNDKIVKWLVKHGKADVKPRVFHPHCVLPVAASDIAARHGKQKLADWLKRECAASACNSRGNKKCRGCLAVYYCGTACQKAHWAVHKQACVKP